MVFKVPTQYLIHKFLNNNWIAGNILPKNLSNLCDLLITSGIAPYYTSPHRNLINCKNKEIAQYGVCFIFQEPLCQHIVKELCYDIDLTDNFMKSIFDNISPTDEIKNENKNENFDVTFCVILAYVSSKQYKK